MTETGRLEGCILAASGAKKPELVLKNARIVNVFTETVEEGDIAIENGMIVGIGAYEGNEERDLKGMYVCPGFIWRVPWFPQKSLNAQFFLMEPQL